MDSRIEAYVKEISQPGIPYISHSHVTLRKLYGEHGQQVIDSLLADHGEQQQKQASSDASSK